eukprot:TRINITY_DN6027_c0_g1_i2.p2 TRINITY_DN6027_c0_g1~~TRINITY_DN6027_c0_g1_i2.p2  ORF type:complete len:100 (+),score=19.55 TRINITY_DN6027_c0_g1_i2:190-489(+)
MATREEKLAQLRAKREKGTGSTEELIEKNRAAVLARKEKRVDELMTSAQQAGMNLEGLDPTVAQFLSQGMTAEEMIAARSANRQTGAATRTAAPPPPPK